MESRHIDQRLRGPLPANRLGGSTDAGIEAVAGIQAPVMSDERRFCLVQVADIVFGWILRAPRVQQCPHPMLEFHRVVALADNIVLVEHVAEDAGTPPDCRAPLRHDKVLDGSDALPDENAQERKYRNGAARHGLQHETGDAHSGRCRTDGSDPRVRWPPRT
jgi:hypothetical protein